MSNAALIPLTGRSESRCSALVKPALPGQRSDDADRDRRDEDRCCVAHERGRRGVGHECEDGRRAHQRSGLHRRDRREQRRHCGADEPVGGEEQYPRTLERTRADVLERGERLGMVELSVGDATDDRVQPGDGVEVDRPRPDADPVRALVNGRMSSASSPTP